MIIWPCFLMICFGRLTSLPVVRAIELVEELRLGGIDADDHALFAATASLAVDDAGTLFVLDSGNQRIVAFDANGRFLRVIGEVGQGPGEFSEPVAMTLDGAGNLVIFDTGSHKMIVLDKQGHFVRDARFASQIHGLYQPVILRGGQLAFTAYRIDSELQMSYDLSVYDAELKAIHTIFSHSMPRLDWTKFEQPAFWVGFLKDQFELHSGGFPLKAVCGDRLIAARTHEYRFTAHDSKGKSQNVWTIEHKPELMAEEARGVYCERVWQDLAANPALTTSLTQPVFKRAMAATSAWQTRPPIAALCSLGKGFAVLADYHILEGTGRLDVYDKEGLLIGKGPYHGTSQFLAGTEEHLYAVGPDEEDFVVVRRFRVKGL